ncbi:hypothetical protein HZF05_18005 [Sphingomonas sp. CGMCC 1.13654]|uniref:Uncharacterized protein n=1 Tax=Sphingomonas chungangi TaxID=2683589 RepID=A0A838LEW7_9SPHN|nr:hypothetical protein [Sphingomonas chungangi]MBA2935978.1 hypothetical protein [Sphingomonas chungangi]MVW55368.1 hypothetical protein [Sphingomonas chungangi]
MTQPGDPPPGSSRSIYERLGLTPSPNAAPLRRPVPIVPAPPAGRKILRYLIGIPLLVAGLALLWMNLPLGGGGPAFAPSSSSEDERRMDSQDAQIKQLELRIEMLEMKVHALQQINGYPEEHGLASRPRPAPRTETSTDIERPADN